MNFIKKKIESPLNLKEEIDQKTSKDSILGYSKGFFIIQLSFLIFISLWQIFHKIFPSIEIILLLTILMLIWKSQHRALLRDLLPFLILLLSFQGLRGFADNLSFFKIHITDLISYEKSLFSGIIPSYYFQSKLSNTVFFAPLGVISSLFYMSHFVIPLIVAMILWRKDRSLYWNFVTGLLVLSYLGFVTYVVYPAAPPWWATKYGYLTDQPVHQLIYTMPSALQIAGPNPVAAMPSLHFAYPTYIVSYCLYVWGKKMSWLVFLPLCVGFSTVYLGHHYVIDLIAGAIYALIVFSLLIIWKNIHQKDSSNSQ